MNNIAQALRFAYDLSKYNSADNHALLTWDRLCRATPENRENCAFLYEDACERLGLAALDVAQHCLEIARANDAL